MTTPSDGDRLAADQRSGLATMEHLISVAQASSVFGAPQAAGDYVVIPAAEVSGGMGFGFGRGGGGPSEEAGASNGYGGGMGGGGGVMARPVAAIKIGPNGVSVVPIVDATKLTLAMVTLVGSAILMLRKMRRASR